LHSGFWALQVSKVLGKLVLGGLQSKTEQRGVQATANKYTKAATEQPLGFPLC